MKYLILTIITLFLIGCNCKKPAAGSGENGDSASVETTKNVILDNEFQQPKDNADFKVLEANIEDDVLTVKVSYSGGCKEHEFNAYFNGMYMKSDPPKAGLFIEHINNGDMCKKMITEELKFNLKNVRYPDKETDYKVMIGMNNYEGYLPYTY